MACVISEPCYSESTQVGFPLQTTTSFRIAGDLVFTHTEQTILELDTCQIYEHPVASIKTLMDHFANSSREDKIKIFAAIIYLLAHECSNLLQVETFRRVVLLKTLEFLENTPTLAPLIAESIDIITQDHYEFWMCRHVIRKML